MLIRVSLAALPAQIRTARFTAALKAVAAACRFRSHNTDLIAHITWARSSGMKSVPGSIPGIDQPQAWDASWGDVLSDRAHAPVLGRQVRWWAT